MKLLDKYLEKKNIKDYPTKRHEITKISCLLGVFSNICLFIVKLILGFLISSVAIISDAFNNLSDSLSFVISLVGLHYASKPADKEHPFGHGRVEYIASFVVTIIIFIAGFEFLTESYKRIIDPIIIKPSLITIILLLLTIIVKVGLSIYLKKVGNEIDNLALIASGEDSRNDVLITSVVLLAIILYRFNNSLPYDGIGGIIVSIFIFISGYNLAKSTITRLLGSQVDEEVLKDIKDMILAHRGIKGVHDLIIHDYGPSVKMGSGHVEMSNQLSLDDAHQIIDEIENDIRNKYDVDFTIHIDPIDVRDRDYINIQRIINDLLASINPDLSSHDLQIDKDKKDISFDIELPFNIDVDHNNIEEILKKELNEKYPNHNINITFDRGFTVTKTK